MTDRGAAAAPTWSFGRLMATLFAAQVLGSTGHSMSMAVGGIVAAEITENIGSTGQLALAAVLGIVITMGHIDAGPAEIAVVGGPDDERTRALHRTALHAAPPGAVLALGDGNPETPSAIPLLEDRGLVDGAPAAYVCRQFTCQAPVTTPGQLTEVLSRPV